LQQPKRLPKTDLDILVIPIICRVFATKKHADNRGALEILGKDFRTKVMKNLDENLSGGMRWLRSIKQ
jgi:hypothetical protein